MAESKLRELSTDFAVKIMKLCETIKGHYSLVNQLKRSATSVGANIHEANYAHGKPDFCSEVCFASVLAHFTSCASTILHSGNATASLLKRHIQTAHIAF